MFTTGGGVCEKPEANQFNPVSRLCPARTWNLHAGNTLYVVAFLARDRPSCFRSSSTLAPCPPDPFAGSLTLLRTLTFL